MAAIRRVQKRLEDDARRRISGEPKLVVPWDDPDAFARLPADVDEGFDGAALPMLRQRNDRPSNIAEGEFWPDELLDPLDGIEFDAVPEPEEEKKVRKEPLREYVRDYAVYGEFRKLQKWVNDGHDPNRPTEHGTTLLHECIKNGYLDCAELLLQNGADVNLGNLNDGLTPLHDAAREGDREVVAFLLQKGAAVDGRSLLGTTPLMRACVGGSVPAVRCLIAFGADVTLVDKVGATAEAFAKKYGHEACRAIVAERARTLELVAWHKAAVREAAYWVQEAAAADAAVCCGVLLHTTCRIDRAVDPLGGVRRSLITKHERRRTTRSRPRRSGRASRPTGWPRSKRPRTRGWRGWPRPRRTGKAGSGDARTRRRSAGNKQCVN